MPKVIPVPEHRKIPVGTFCLILRPNLWQGFHCLVVEHRPECHLCRLVRMDSTSFLTPVKFEELKPCDAQNISVHSTF